MLPAKITRRACVRSSGRGAHAGLEDILPVTQVNISQHLTVLRNAKLVDFAQDGGTRCYYLSRPKLVDGVLAQLAADHPAIRKTKEQIDREKARAGKETAGSRG